MTSLLRLALLRSIGNPRSEPKVRSAPALNFSLHTRFDYRYGSSTYQVSLDQSFELGMLGFSTSRQVQNEEPGISQHIAQEENMCSDHPFLRLEVINI